ncbi:Eco57I restriction-modification methylase domain-containing protein [Pseudoxanthomonas mexicana]|uniref:Eco57I restriction-modification methylase domain-containing protein n=1 Tax=Pseudoxanthomonas mexicana TaxID=128785 RepID=UPI00398B6171
MTDPAELREAAKARVAELVALFKSNEAERLDKGYNETQARTDFITPLLGAFGWDVYNASGQSSLLRDVVEEATVEVGEKLNKRPDYELRLAGQRKFFVEAKKPSVSIETNKEAAFQVRRYGFSAGFAISVLTNFHRLAVYDTTHAPNANDEANYARLLLVNYDEFEARFDELWPILSRQSVHSGEFDRKFAVPAKKGAGEQFDDLFLRQVRSWREILAKDIQQNTPGLSTAELTYAVQVFLSRIIFLRICEDRDIETYENLKARNTFALFMDELRRADAFYNSDLFRLLDDEKLGIKISDAALQAIFEDLYYPKSPYTFAVVDTHVLGEIYEQFLGDEIQVDGGVVSIVNRPEVRESDGVFPTPGYIVDLIVSKTLRPLLDGKSPAQVEALSVIDICCGSGIFLLSLYELLMDHYLSWYLANDPAAHDGVRIFDSGAGQWRLTFAEKRRILLAHVRGVDIDASAVEVAQFSLLLKLIERETQASLTHFATSTKQKPLPSLDMSLKSGNSLVSQAEWENAKGPMPVALLDKVRPFDWEKEFPEEMARGGFDVVVGNPPYIRIQNMATYSAEEVAYYHDEESPYLTAKHDNFDKYALFVERSLSLLSPQGRLGIITPHKFMTIQAGRALRKMIAGQRLLEEVVHFGVKQVFENSSNYTCILILSRVGADVIQVEHPGPLDEWRYGNPGTVAAIPADTLDEEPWQFASAETVSLIAKMRAAHPHELGQVAEIFVGVQTSADAIYIFTNVSDAPGTLVLSWAGQEWPIEREICRPCLLDGQLGAYEEVSANRWMIFPYVIQADVAGGQTVELIPPERMETDFPNCFAYLNARRAELERRNIVGGRAGSQQFYQFGRSQSLAKFNSPKIVLPALSTDARYAYDEANVMATGGGNGPYYMMRARLGSGVSDKYLMAVLHHPFSEAIVRTHTSAFRGGYYSHGKQFIEHLPIPLPSEEKRTAIEAMVSELIATKMAAGQAKIPVQRILQERHAEVLITRIESEITALFGLSAEDMEVVRLVEAPS